jgi:dihydrofolate synthase/folylpolyglutamate synthase
MDMLGETLDLIAREKAGIIKEKTAVLVVNDSGQRLIFKEVANKLNAPLHYASEFTTPDNLNSDLKGKYQTENIAGVYAACSLLAHSGYKLDEAHIKKGLNNVVKNTGLRGRWETLNSSPLTIADTAHNEDGLKITIEEAKSQCKGQLHMVIGTVKDKNLNSILSLFPRDALYYFCQAKVPRALNVNELAALAESFELKGMAYPSVQAAIDAANSKARSNDLIYIGGSNFVVAEAI